MDRQTIYLRSDVGRRELCVIDRLLDDRGEQLTAIGEGVIDLAAILARDNRDCALLHVPAAASSHLAEVILDRNALLAEVDRLRNLCSQIACMEGSTDEEHDHDICHEIAKAGARG